MQPYHHCRVTLQPHLTRLPASQAVFCRAEPQSTKAQPLLLHRIILSQALDFPFIFAKLLEISSRKRVPHACESPSDRWPFLPAYWLLPPIWCHPQAWWGCTICYPIIQVINGGVKHYLLQNQLFGMMLGTSHHQAANCGTLLWACKYC